MTRVFKGGGRGLNKIFTSLGFGLRYLISYVYTILTLEICI